MVSDGGGDGSDIGGKWQVNDGLVALLSFSL